jgi:hypothetical protein
MNKTLLAFFLACLTVSGLLSSCTLLHPTLHQRPIQVNISSDNDVHDVVTAVEALHRPDIDVHTMKASSISSGSFFWLLPFWALGFMLITGLVLFFYKIYCRWLHVNPQI